MPVKHDALLPPLKYLVPSIKPTTYWMLYLGSQVAMFNYVWLYHEAAHYEASLLVCTGKSIVIIKTINQNTPLKTSAGVNNLYILIYSIFGCLLTVQT